MCHLFRGSQAQRLCTVTQTPANPEYRVCCLNSLLLSGGLLLPAESPHRSLPIWGQGSQAMKLVLPALEVVLPLSFPEMMFSDTFPTKWVPQHRSVKISFINKVEITFMVYPRTACPVTGPAAAALLVIRGKGFFFCGSEKLCF